MEAIEAWLLQQVLSFLANKIAEAVAAWERDKQNQAIQEAQAEQDTAKAGALTPDSTGEEVSAAIDDELRHF
jgi:hypothetical protein